MNNPLGDESSSASQRQFTTVEFVCPKCHEIPDVSEVRESVILLRPCGHKFRCTDLAAITEHLQIFDDLIQRLNTTPTPLERQGIREDIHTMGAKFDADLERCEANMIL